MTTRQEPDLPSAWLPISRFLTDERDAFPLRVPDHTWVRLVADATRGGPPYLMIEAFWIAGKVIHKVQLDEYCLAGGDAPPTDGALHLVGHERIALERLEKMHMDSSGTQWIEITGVGRRDDLPTFLILSHVNAGAEGYAAGM